MPVRALRCLSKLTALALFCLACAKGPPSGGPGNYRGLVIGAQEIGVLEVTVEEKKSGPLPATGTLKFPSKDLTLTGTLDRSKTELSLSSSEGYSLVATSRPAYAYGSFIDQAGTDVGSFGLVQESDGSTVELFCGSVTTSTSSTSTSTSTSTTTQASTSTFGVAAVPGGGAVCVGLGFTVSGNLTNDDALLCTTGTGFQFKGSVSSSTDNTWFFGNSSGGTWSVTPCANNGLTTADGGVPDSAPTGAPDAGDNH